MSDPLLTTLCTICHREPPKYKCPRCGVRTCSLPCTKKHKAWASCSGERDPAAFIPRERLVTDAGVDHDYNFISKIERAKERFEKTVVAEKGLLGEAEVRGPKRGQEDRRFEKVWYGDQLVHEPATRGGGGARGGWRGGRGGGLGRDTLQQRFDQQVRQRLRRNDIRVLTMPKGLSRQKENKTAWNRRTNTVNWQVEWFLFGIGGAEEASKATRICHKSLDEKPLYQALADTLEWDKSANKSKRAREEGDLVDDEDAPPHKKHKGPSRKQRAVQQVAAMIPCQDSASSTWPVSEYAMQCTATGRWNQMSSDPAVPPSSEEEAAQLAKLRFFLFKPATPDEPSKGLIPLSPTDNLVGALSGRTIIEFPTVYVLQPDAPMPEGMALASTERRSADSDSDSEEDSKAASFNRGPARNGRRFERTVEDPNPSNANRAPLRNNRLSGRRGGGGPDHAPMRRDKSAVTDKVEIEEGELNSEGEEVYKARRAMDMVTASIVADASSFGGGSIMAVDGDAEPELPKAAMGLVDYGSDSE
ncbi:Box C/D snoRNA protein 1 [Coniochaeta hoffmannii]|uniref:Box C/D snoRNA protein 1 n=1 Tax=Coniochaeta hoffmannii TaxID=91930 RepID=A0AA38W235_9PEZI|nr:Box C/D snoRNA protein 1 [Coniochaeta hoffmannii]